MFQVLGRIGKEANLTSRFRPGDVVSEFSVTKFFTVTVGILVSRLFIAWTHLNPYRGVGSVLTGLARIPDIFVKPGEPVGRF